MGPRYCPSIEDKIHRFADKSSHQIFIEPEGLTSTELYPNGISTSLPFDIQLDLVRSIKGLESARITRRVRDRVRLFDPRDCTIAWRPDRFVVFTLRAKLTDNGVRGGRRSGLGGRLECRASRFR